MLPIEPHEMLMNPCIRRFALVGVVFSENSDSQHSKNQNVPVSVYWLYLHHPSQNLFVLGNTFDWLYSVEMNIGSPPRPLKLTWLSLLQSPYPTISQLLSFAVIHLVFTMCYIQQNTCGACGGTFTTTVKCPKGNCQSTEVVETRNTCTSCASKRAAKPN